MSRMIDSCTITLTLQGQEDVIACIGQMDRFVGMLSMSHRHIQSQWDKIRDDWTRVLSLFVCGR